MATKFTAAQVGQYRRDAKRLQRTSTIPLHEAQDRIAALHGFANWSLLIKHSDASEKGPSKPARSSTAPAPYAKRYYLHGDQSEDNPALYFCARCDAFFGAEHWAEGASRWHKDGKDGERFLISLERWQRRPPERARRLRRSDDAPNLLAERAFAERDAYEAARSPFHHWLEAQRNRDDHIGDFAADTLRDERFPVDAMTRQVAREYLSRRGVHTWVMRALRDAWAEFEAQRRG